VNLALRAEGIVTHPQGISNVVMLDWGLHLYFNNVSLVSHASIDGHGFPWTLAENAGLARDYAKGVCPTADSLFERTVLIPIPSNLTKRDEDDIIHAFQKVLSVLL
jgi:8-amino-3,8-dideoxy-alpha-D-manno-octulosonate transaminase